MRAYFQTTRRSPGDSMYGCEQCQCDNGVIDSTANCVDGVGACVAGGCDAGYRLCATNDVSISVGIGFSAPCEGAEPASTDLATGYCIKKMCKCYMPGTLAIVGRGSEGRECPIHGQNKCTSCDAPGMVLSTTTNLCVCAQQNHVFDGTGCVPPEQVVNVNERDAIANQNNGNGQSQITGGGGTTG